MVTYLFVLCHIDTLQYYKLQGVPLATKPSISLIILTPMKILQRKLNRSMLRCHHISHTTNVLPFKFRCNIFIDVRIIKEMPGSVASGTPCTSPPSFAVNPVSVNLTVYNSAIIVTIYKTS